jgi:hypothetical protein
MVAMHYHKNQVEKQRGKQLNTEKSNKNTLLSKKFEELLLLAIDEALSTLGEPSKTAIYFFLEKQLGITKAAIPNQLEAFSDALYQLLGLGAKHLEILCIKNLHKNLQSKQALNELDCLTSELTLVVFVKMKRNQFEKSSENYEMGILFDTERKICL